MLDVAKVTADPPAVAVTTPPQVVVGLGAAATSTPVNISVQHFFRGALAVLHTWPETGTVNIDIFSCPTRLTNVSMSL